jgi:glycosyltransferase involved in cell wall biosynthesis
VNITLVNGFFLPVPPVSGGSTEKSWFRLGQEFAARGHAVTSFSRAWSGFPAEETIKGVKHRRFPGYDHSRTLWRNLACDFLWSARLHRQLPPADIVICNTVTMPVWLGRTKPSAGRVVVMCGRMPKGQFRHYARLARVLAPSSLVRERILAENRALEPAIRVSGYPIDHSLLATPQPAASFLPSAPDDDTVTLGFAGRIHDEKGLLLLADALIRLAARPGLPPWRLILCGPSDIARGGAGSEYRSQLLGRLAACGPAHPTYLLDPQFGERALAAVYQSFDIFCYPSLAEQGETFGVAVAEAMAAGAVPVVSDLKCFTDFVHHGVNGVTFNHRATDPAVQLAEALENLLRDAAQRRRLAAAATESSRRFDFAPFAEQLLTDFAGLDREPDQAS